MSNFAPVVPALVGVSDVELVPASPVVPVGAVVPSVAAVPVAAAVISDDPTPSPVSAPPRCTREDDGRVRHDLRQRRSRD